MTMTATATAVVTSRATRIGRALGRLSDMIALSRQRAELAALDTDRLADLGLSRTDARNEARRKPWDVPAHWRR